MGFDAYYSVFQKVGDEYRELNFYDAYGRRLYDSFPSKDRLLNHALLNVHTATFNFEPIAYERELPTYFDRKLDHHDFATWYDYCELRAWSNNNSYMFEDVDGEIRNPIVSFMNIVNFILDAYGISNPVPGDVVIICEGDW